MEDELDRIIEQYQIKKELKEHLLRFAETRLEFHLEEEEDYKQMGNSRIAGYPDLPPHIKWPCVSDDEYCSFIAQINLSELPYSPCEDLPSKGILYFFLGLDEPATDVEHNLFYYDGDLSVLKRTKPPKRKVEVGEGDRDFDSYKISFKPKVVIGGEYLDNEELLDTLRCEYNQVYQLLCNSPATVWGEHTDFYEDSLEQAYLCKNGLEDLLYTHKEESHIREKAAQAAERGNSEDAEYLLTKLLPLVIDYQKNEELHQKGIQNWQVLFSISSLEEAGMMWWDAGYLEVLIDKNDLKNNNFDRTFVKVYSS
ncbi:DUF1963 domain-containing protein [Paenibacillus sp. 481]|nr:DUF1963 domain-containing protein [Paenibacillus sp. 481]